MSNTNKIVIGALLVVFAALQYALWLGDYGLIRLWQLDTTVNAQQEENNRLTVRNQRLHAEVIDLKKGHDALEERARSELGMIKKGETFYQVIEPDSRSKQP